LQGKKKGGKENCRAAFSAEFKEGGEERKKDYWGLIAGGGKKFVNRLLPGGGEKRSPFVRSGKTVVPPQGRMGEKRGGGSSSTRKERLPPFRKGKKGERSLLEQIINWGIRIRGIRYD